MNERITKKTNLLFLRSEIDPLILFACCQINLFNSVYLNHNRIQKRVLASQSFHGKERFDSIQLLGTNDATWFAQLRLIFSMTFDGKTRELCYLQYFGTNDKAHERNPTLLRLTNTYQVRYSRSECPNFVQIEKSATVEFNR